MSEICSSHYSVHVIYIYIADQLSHNFIDFFSAFQYVLLDLFLDQIERKRMEKLD